jgi:hypothetical protein
MHSQGTPVTLAQNLKVPSRLRRFNNAEREFLSGHRQFHRIVAGDL